MPVGKPAGPTRSLGGILNSNWDTTPQYSHLSAIPRSSHFGFESPIPISILPAMHGRVRSFLVLVLVLAAPLAQAASGRVIKVLPLYLDLKGREMLSPSLFERDAYQARLRQHPEQRSALSFAVQWKAKAAAGAPLKLRVQLRGGKKDELPTQVVLEETVQQKGPFSHWATLRLSGEAYRKFGELAAWRATLWDGDTLLGEQKSFLW